MAGARYGRRRRVRRAARPDSCHPRSGEGRQVPPPRQRRNELDRDDAERGARWRRGKSKRKRESPDELSRIDVIDVQAAALTSPLVGTDAIVLRICEAIWYGSPCEFGRRSSR